MIRIKAPRVWRLNPLDDSIPPSHYNQRRIGAECGRWYTEAMHRRVMALVRACEGAEAFKGREPIWNALAALRAQAEKEARK